MNKNETLRHNAGLLLKRKREVLFIYVFLILICVIVGLTEKTFFKPINIKNVMSISASLCIASFAQLLIILLGGVDLSVGAIISVSSAICAMTMKDTPAGWVLPVLMCLGFGLLGGFCNGLLVTKGHQQAIIATLATSSIISGIALIIMPKPGGYIHSGFSKFINRGLGNMVPIISLGIFGAVMWILLNRTGFGRQLFAVGGNEESAKSVGIRTDRVKIIAFSLAGVLAAAAGVYLTAYMSAGDPIIGSQYSQRTITAVVVGGTSLAGGKGSVVGTIAGALMIGLINNMMNLLGISSYYQYILQGLILVAALTISTVKSR